ncbi:MULTISPECIES: hypothetical protein [unclassified Variovorax]|nr:MULTISPECIES: hypothetical protein [unclassified Variovorax]SEK16565.1 hypothetical protein SAMN05518853_12737 [Variovorax sp. OK202]SFE52773.1 hypothetical protein SAMN05444746_12737 [Variovorax sp. OK212]
MLDGLQKAGINLDEVAALAGFESDDLKKPLKISLGSRASVPAMF